jgi:two-component system chemotaxis sensor kinase CheA
MSIDVSQFHQVFFEESFEGLEVMEMGLLGMQEGTPDVETINSIFRAAHSIKGGAGTFGFMHVSDFTHGLETLLDMMRNGERDVTRESIDVMLQSVDVLREMLTAVQQDSDVDDARVKDIADQIQALMQEDGEAASASTDTVEEEQAESGGGWKITFKPHEHLLQTGNEPIRMIREVAELGDISVELDSSATPDFTDYEPESCYFSWVITLTGEGITANQINEIFEWVEDDCDFELEEIAVAASTSTQTATSEEMPAEDLVAAEPEPNVKTEPTATPQVEAQDKPAAPPSQAKKPAADAPASSIRVGTDKVDSLINLVGELVITQSMLSQMGENFEPSLLPKLVDGLEQLERNTRELQEGIMRIRMLPISFAFNRFPRLVHDLSGKMGKKVELKLSGEQTELDKTVMEKIGDPLVHLVRNSLDHGLEMPEARVEAGKPETGILHLNAYHQSGNIVIEINDDGAGLNEDKILKKSIERGLVQEGENLSPEKIHELIFLPGFSTADVISDVSGRGVGMDVVRRNIHSLGGSVEVRSQKGKGSTFTIRLPLTLAIMDGQAIQVAGQKFILPLISIVESVEVKPGTVKRVNGKGELYTLRDEYIPIIRLYDVFNLEPEIEQLEEGLLVIVEFEDKKVGLFVDELLAQQQVVIKSLETNYRKVMGVAGATILGDGTVALILDIAGLHAMFKDRSLLKLVHQNIQAA